MQGREHHLTARQCLEMGLVDEIVGELDLLTPYPKNLLASIEGVGSHSAA